MLLILGTRSDTRDIKSRFHRAHRKDKIDITNNRIQALPKNLPHQTGLNSLKSILDEPYSITSIVKRVVESPKVVRFNEISETPGKYTRVYELGFDQFIGKCYPSNPLNCKVVQIVLRDLSYREAFSTGKNSCLLSFTLHKQFTIPLHGVSTQQHIIKYWDGRDNVNHRAIFYDRRFPAPLDIRPLGSTASYTTCFYPNCSKCSPQTGPQPTTSQQTTGELPPPGTKEDQ